MSDNFPRSEQDWLRESVSLLALAAMKGVGYWTLFKLSNAGIKFNQVIKASDYKEFEGYFSQAGCRAPKIPDKANWEEFQQTTWAAGNELNKKLKRADTQLIHFDQPDFPSPLREIEDPPRWLFVQGSLAVLHRSALAIVGTRKPTKDGRFLADFMGTCLGYLDTVTVSGLATGIDQMIHQASIRFLVPTVAVLGNGIFVDFPAGSEELRRDICLHGGAVVTEYLPNQSYSAENFVRRNRLQAALGKALIPIEWQSKSGTAHTVRFASAARKPIFCLKLPDWKEREHDELSLARELGAKDFVVPVQSNNLIDELYLTIHGKPRPETSSQPIKSPSACVEVAAEYNLEEDKQVQQLSFLDGLKQN